MHGFGCELPRGLPNARTTGIWQETGSGGPATNVPITWILV